MKINIDRPIEIIIQFGKLKIFVNGERVHKSVATEDAARTLGLIVGVLQREGVIK